MIGVVGGRSEIGHLTDAEFDAARHLLARAFAADPIIGHYLEGEARRTEALPDFF
jgi:hypothetical protein